MVKNTLNRNRKINCLASLGVFIILVVAGNPMASDDLLKPPGLRPLKNPLIVIPAFFRYRNQPPPLPEYRSVDGQLANGWYRRYVKIRRFQSNQSAWVYYRTSDLARSKRIQAEKKISVMRIWPLGTTLVLESYLGNAIHNKDAKPIDIVAMKKTDARKHPSKDSFYAVSWSYARYTPAGNPILSAQIVQECHQCHSIAFHITGDLVYTPFP